jgi:hypothetical protein
VYILWRLQESGPAAVCSWCGAWGETCMNHGLPWALKVSTYAAAFCPIQSVL